MRNTLFVLSRQYNSINCCWFAIFITNCDLRFRIWTQPRKLSIFAQLCLLFHQQVRVGYWHWHQYVCLATSVAEHQTLVTSTLIQIYTFTFINTLSNIHGLLVQSNDNGATVIVKAHIRRVIAYVLDCLTYTLLNIIKLAFCGYLTRKNYHSGIYQSLASNS